MSELFKKSFLFFSTSLLKSIGLLCLTFFLTPVLLKNLGANDFGVFKVLMELYGHLSLLEMGLYSSLLACIIPALNNKNGSSLNSLMWEGRRQYIMAAFLTFAVSLLLFPLLPFIVSWGEKSKGELYLTYGFIAATSVLIPFQTYRAYLEASNRGYKVNLIIFAQNLLFLIIGTYLAVSGMGLVSQGIAVFITGIFGVTLIWYYANLKIKKKIHPDAVKQIRRHQLPQVLNDLGTKLCLNCDHLIISMVLGPMMVTKVFLGQRVILILQAQLQSIGQSSCASLGSLFYSDHTLFKQRIIEVTKLISVVAAAVLIPACIMNQSFILLWVGEEYQINGSALTYLSAANCFLLSLFTFWALVFTVLGKSKEITKMTWFQAAINIFSSVMFTYILGGVGPIVGTLISLIMIPLWNYPHLLSKHFDLEKSEIFKAIIGPFLISIGLVGTYHFLPVKISNHGWAHFFSYGILIFLSCFSLLFVLVFNPQEKSIFINRIRNLWKKISGE